MVALLSAKNNDTHPIEPIEQLSVTAEEIEHDPSFSGELSSIAFPILSVNDACNQFALGLVLWKMGEHLINGTMNFAVRHIGEKATPNSISDTKNKITRTLEATAPIKKMVNELESSYRNSADQLNQLYGSRIKSDQDRYEQLIIKHRTVKNLYDKALDVEARLQELREKKSSLSTTTEIKQGVIDQLDAELSSLRYTYHRLTTELKPKMIEDKNGCLFFSTNTKPYQTRLYEKSPPPNPRDEDGGVHMEKMVSLKK
jgi:hypothetical protein